MCDDGATLTFARSSGYRMEKNVIIAGGPVRITRPDAISKAASNIVLSTAGKVEGVKLEDYRQMGAEPIESNDGWLLIDPRLVEYETGKVRFAPGSPVEELGIEPIDVSEAGCTRE